jgi:hypothetical protein
MFCVITRVVGPQIKTTHAALPDLVIVVAAECMAVGQFEKAVARGRAKSLFGILFCRPIVGGAAAHL